MVVYIFDLEYKMTDDIGRKNHLTERMNSRVSAPLLNTHFG